MQASNFIRWGTLQQLRDRYSINRNRAYQLLRENKLRAKKLGGRTVWDFASADELFETLPDCGGD
jgi:hypothetical protein